MMIEILIMLFFMIFGLVLFHSKTKKQSVLNKITQKKHKNKHVFLLKITQRDNAVMQLLNALQLQLLSRVGATDACYFCSPERQTAISAQS